jgi:salicylate hydroxylase
VDSSRTVIVAGAGIGGLAAALALARHGLRVVVLEQAEQLEETGAGIQLSPNASRILLRLGLGEHLTRGLAVADEVMVASARNARVFARIPLGAAAEQRYGAPYWIIHRGDLQAALRAAVEAHPAITLRLGARVDDFAIHGSGMTVAAHSRAGIVEVDGDALVAADGLWSRLRGRLGHSEPPRFAGCSAWRALVPADAVAPELRAPVVRLWLGRGGHVVHYPVKAGRVINVVAIARDDWRETGWSTPVHRSEVLSRFGARSWRGPAREILSVPDRWLKWALYDAAPLTWWGRGPVTLLGDAAHPTLPYLAQGAAMAIEDAAVLGQWLGTEKDPAAAMRRYEHARLARTARTQRAARRTGTLYHLGGAAGLLRTMGLAALSGRRLLARYDWLYGWKETEASTE